MSEFFLMEQKDIVGHIANLRTFFDIINNNGVGDVYLEQEDINDGCNNRTDEFSQALRTAKWSLEDLEEDVGKTESHLLKDAGYSSYHGECKEEFLGRFLFKPQALFGIATDKINVASTESEKVIGYVSAADLPAFMRGEMCFFEPVENWRTTFAFPLMQLLHLDKAHQDYRAKSIGKKFYKYRVDADSVADFLRKYYKPERYTEKGYEYEMSLLASYRKEFADKGYCFISFHDSKTGETVAYYGKEAVNEEGEFQE